MCPERNLTSRCRRLRDKKDFCLRKRIVTIDNNIRTDLIKAKRVE